MSASDIRQLDLDTLAHMADEEISQLLVDSDLSATEKHLELHFIWFRRFYGYIGFETARAELYSGKPTNAALTLMQTMIEMVNSDAAIHVQELKRKLTGMPKDIADKRWRTEDRNQLDDPPLGI